MHERKVETKDDEAGEIEIEIESERKRESMGFVGWS